jgi:Lysophospholipase
MEARNGQEKVPRLLLLHGLADSAFVWTTLGNYLSNRYHIVAPDMRGHGESSKPETGYTFESAIADLEALMAHLNYFNQVCEKPLVTHLLRLKINLFGIYS